MAAFSKFNALVADLTAGKHNFGSDALKVMLTNTVPSAANAVKADITEISAGNGYGAGGSAATLVSNGQTGGTEKLIVNDVVFTAAGGTVGPFRYAVLYNATPAGGPLIGYHDYGSSVTIGDGETFTWDADQTAGILQIA